VRSTSQLGTVPAAVPLLADDILEFHAARLLLLFAVCGTAGRIDGLTKMAKLDFFVRYPAFFVEVCEKLGMPVKAAPASTVESAMVRHHYGPWDQRYYQILGYLEGRGLLQARQSGKPYSLLLTAAGKEAAMALRKNPAFSDLTEQMKQVKEVLGGKSGTSIKNLIYKTFRDEVAERPMGKTIEKQ